MNPSRQIVITGMGVISPIGIGREAFWQSLCAGRSGVAPLTLFDARSMPVSFGAELKQFDARQYVRPRKALKVMCREIQTAFAAAMLAVDDARLDTSQTVPERLGAVFGSQMCYGDVHDLEDLYRHCMVAGQFQFQRFGDVFPSHLFPLHLLKHLPNMAACHVAIALDARGPNNTIVLGEASSLLALIEAWQILRRDLADVMIVGASGSRISLTAWMYRGDLRLSHRADDPAAASRPFDADRDGMVNGEGAAAIVLETRQHAEQRGANILAEVCGAGLSMDTGHEGPASLAAAIGRSIQQATPIGRRDGVRPESRQCARTQLPAGRCAGGCGHPVAAGRCAGDGVEELFRQHRAGRRTGGTRGQPVGPASPSGAADTELLHPRPALSAARRAFPTAAGSRPTCSNSASPAPDKPPPWLSATPRRQRGEALLLTDISTNRKRVRTRHTTTDPLACALCLQDRDVCHEKHFTALPRRAGSAGPNHAHRSTHREAPAHTLG